MNDADLCHSGQPKEEAVAVIDQVFQSWAELSAEPLPAAPDPGPPATAEDRQLLAPARLPRGNPHLSSDYVRELQAEFEEQEEGGKLR